MWTFEQDKYQKQLLAPAVTEFAKSGDLPDPFARYYLELEVSYNLDDIEQATKTVVGFWNKTQNNPRYEKLLKVLISQHKEKVGELTDEPSRETLRKITKDERKKNLEKRFSELDTHIQTVAGKGYLTPVEKNKLINDFTLKGLTEQEILSRIKVPIEERVVKPPEQGLEEATRRKIRNNLATLGKKNLYEFLDIRPGASKAELEQKYQELTSYWNKKINDNKKTSAQNLLSIVKDKLVKEGLEKYEKALVWDVIDNELKAMFELAASDRIIAQQEFEELIKSGIKFGLSREQTTEAILWLAHAKGAVVEQDKKRVDAVICAECRASIPKENNKCTSCGADLWVICPDCTTTTKIAASETACGVCGFVTANRYRVDLLIRKAQIAFDNKQLDDALKFASEAKKLWKNSGDVAVTLNKVEQLLDQAKSCRKDYDEAMSQKKLLTAKDRLIMLIKISPYYKGWDGKTPNDLQHEFGVQSQKVEKLLEKARQAETDRKTAELIRIYQEIQNIAIDYEEVQKGFKRYPPEPPSNIITKVYDNGIVIKWNESSAFGKLEYVVVRCENRQPATVSDGDVIAKVPNNSFNDESVRPGSFVYYGIFAERGGAFSSGTFSKGDLAIREVEGFSLEGGEGVVHGSWKAVSEGKVRVLCGSEFELRSGNGREVQLTNPHSFTDNNLTNDKTYSYRIFVEYTTQNGNSVTTSGKLASATPTIPPKAIERLEMRSENGELHFIWSPPPFGTVSVYRFSQKPSWKSGTKISATALNSIGTPLRNKREGLAIDSNIAKSRVYYTPFTIAGDSIIVGQTKSFVPAEEISDLTVEDFETYLLLRWKWTGSFQAVVVTWRHDDYSVDAEDKKAVIQKVSKGEYDLNGGFRIPNPKKKPYKFVVYTIAENEDKTVYSVGLNPDCRTETRTLSPVKITYSLKTKGWWKWKSFVLSLKSEQRVSFLPEVLVVAKPGETQPLDSESGKIVARIENASIEPSLPFEYEFEMPKVKRPFFVRLFFATPNSYQIYKLSDPPPKQLKVR